MLALTGAFGFIGRRVIARLEEDEAVERIITVDVRSPVDLVERAGVELRPLELLEQHPKLSVHNLDLTEPGADRHLAEICESEGVDTLCHLAFLSSPTHAGELAHELETIGTLKVLNAARAARVPRLISLSSTMCYGARHDNPAYMREDHALRGSRKSRYLSDRIDAEEQVMRFAEANPETAVAIARLGAFVGPGSKHFWSRFLLRPVVVTALGYDPLFQLLFIDDAIDGLEALTMSSATGVFNVVGRGALPLSRVLRGLGRRALPIPATATHGLLRALWGAQLLEMPPVFADYLQWPWLADGSRLQDEVGFSPAPIQEVLDRVVRDEEAGRAA